MNIQEWLKSIGMEDLSDIFKKICSMRKCLVNSLLVTFEDNR